MALSRARSSPVLPVDCLQCHRRGSSADCIGLTTATQPAARSIMLLPKVQDALWTHHQLGGVLKLPPPAGEGRGYIHSLLWTAWIDAKYSYTRSMLLTSEGRGMRTMATRLYHATPGPKISGSCD